MLKKIIVFLSVTLLSQESYSATVSAIADDESSEVLKRQRVGVCTEDIAILFMQKFFVAGKKLEKTKIHKLLYFMNGLNYALEGSPIIQEPFEAHKYGPIQTIIQNDFDRISKKVAESLAELTAREAVGSGLPGGEPLESKTETSFTIFESYTSGDLSRMTHEPDTPWSIKREDWGKRQHHRGLVDMYIPLEWDRDYFTKPERIERFFLAPYVSGKVNRNDHTAKVLSLLLENHPSLLDNYMDKILKGLEGQVTKIKDVSSEARSDADLRDQIQGIIGQTEGLDSYDDIFRPHLHKFFVHSAQSLTEGLLAETLYPFDFIVEGEVNLFFNPSFRQLTALAAGFKSLPALYYLGRIFETFSEGEVSDEESKASAGATSSDDSRDTLSLYTGEIETLLQTTARTILGSTQTSRWQDVYEKVLAISYESAGDITDLVDQGLSIKTLPERYRKDGSRYKRREKVAQKSGNPHECSVKLQTLFKKLIIIQDPRLQ